MTKMFEDELKAILAAEKADSMQSLHSSELSDQRTRAIDYYMGDVSQDIPTVDGLSTAVSTDVADTIEGLMPGLMEIFAGSEDAVRFDPVGPEDIPAAEQETAYTQHVFWQLNDGYLVLHNFIKDALLSKLGVVKVWWNEEEKEESETYRGLGEDELALIGQAQDVEIAEQTDHPDGTHDVKVVYKTKHAQAKVEGVPPEEFGVSRRARRVRDAHYCFHEVIKSQDELISAGYDESQVSKLQPYCLPTGTETQARDSVDETDESDGDAALNKAMRPLRVTEHYIRMDYEGKGKAKLYRVTTGGEEGVVLKRDGQLDVVEQDYIPFATMTPIIMPHRVFGLSVADRVMDIQRIKTALTRGLLDNTYAANMPRPVVSQDLSTTDTIDDLLVHRHGAIIRAKAPGAVEWQKVPSIANHIFPVMQYFDATREWRSGVSRQSQGLDADALQNQTATAAQQEHNASHARMKLIARNFAETGIKDLFWLLHATIRKNAKQEATVRLNNNWVPVDPRNWKTRNDLTVTVGLGQGGKKERIGEQMMLIELQKEAIANGQTRLVQPKHLYNSAKELAKLLETDVELFFGDPGDEPAEEKPDPKMMELQVKSELDQQSMQMKAEIEKLQAQADIETQNQKAATEAQLAERKFQFDMAMEERRFELEREMKMLEAQMKMQTAEHSLQEKERGAQLDEKLAFDKADRDERIALRKLKMEQNSKKAMEGEQVSETGELEQDVEHPMAGAVTKLGEMLMELSKQQEKLQAVVTAPRKAEIVRGKNGKATHAVSTVVQ
jgi:hypothetical protein